MHSQLWLWNNAIDFYQTSKFSVSLIHRLLRIHLESLNLDYYFWVCYFSIKSKKLNCFNWIFNWHQFSIIKCVYEWFLLQFSIWSMCNHWILWLIKKQKKPKCKNHLLLVRNQSLHFTNNKVVDEINLYNKWITKAHRSNQVTMNTNKKGLKCTIPNSDNVV